MTKWLVCRTLFQAFLVGTLAMVTQCKTCYSHSTFFQPGVHVYEMVTSRFIWGMTLQWTSIPSGGRGAYNCRWISSRLMLLSPTRGWGTGASKPSCLPCLLLQVPVRFHNGFYLFVLFLLQNMYTLLQNFSQFLPDPATFRILLPVLFSSTSCTAYFPCTPPLPYSPGPLPPCPPPLNRQGAFHIDPVLNLRLVGHNPTLVLQFLLDHLLQYADISSITRWCAPKLKNPCRRTLA